MSLFSHCVDAVPCILIDIAESQGRPENPALEMLYRQTSACVVQLGLSGVGAAAFADMPKEFLDA